MTVMKRLPLLLILMLLILPNTSQAQDIPWYGPGGAAAVQDIPRFNIWAGVGFGLPTGNFSFSHVMNGGYAEPVGFTYKYGLAVRFTRGLYLLGEIMVIHFPIEQVTLAADAGEPMDDARWDIDGVGVSLLTDFGERGNLRVYFQGGAVNYTGSTGVATGPLAAAKELKSGLTFNAGMGLFILVRPVTFDLGLRVHMPTFDFIERFDKTATWISLDLGILYGVG